MSAQTKPQRVRVDRLTVLALVDYAVMIPGTSEFYDGESDRHVADALRRMAKKVVVAPYIGADQLLSTLDEVKPDVVFNLTQRDKAGDRQKDGHICALMELRGIPYTGAGPRGLILGRDKALSKLIAAQTGFKVPGFFVVQNNGMSVNAEFPMVVKPRYGDASEGVSQAALVRTKEALLQRIDYLRRSGFDDIICEEFVAGREMVVGVLGERMAQPREFIVERKGPGSPLLACFRFKYDKEFRRRWGVRADTAELTPRQKSRLRELTLRASEVLEMRDYGRLDVKLTPSGEWAFLEANPNPGLAPYGTSWAGTWAGVDYDSMIKEIVQRAVRRGG